MTHDEGVAVLRKLIAAYPHPPVAEETLVVYLERLLPLDARAVAWAVNTLIDADLPYLPRVGRIRRVALDYLARQAGMRQTERYLLPAPDRSHEERVAARQRVTALIAGLPFMRNRTDG